MPAASTSEPLPHSVFALPEHLAAKNDSALVAADETHFAAIAHTISQSVSELVTRLDEARRAPGGVGQEAMDRDLEVHRLTARLRLLRRFGRDLCLGRMVSAADGGEPVYVGRLGLTDSGGRRLLIDWRSPAAEPFFAATHAHPMGLASRRRYRWTCGLITDFWDEVYASAPGSDEESRQCAALDDQSAFIASLGSTKSPRMRDVLGTIQADQDAIIRAGSAGALVVDGGPGTGKTVVALHRAAYLLYSDPRTCSTATRASATIGAVCCSSDRTSTTSPTWPMSCPASARKACRPAPCATWSQRARARRTKTTRRSPG